MMNNHITYSQLKNLKTHNFYSLCCKDNGMGLFMFGDGTLYVQNLMNNIYDINEYHEQFGEDYCFDLNNNIIGLPLSNNLWFENAK